ncbi:uncharacterized protein At4g06744, partial [Arachis ipaensis]
PPPPPPPPAACPTSSPPPPPPPLPTCPPPLPPPPPPPPPTCPPPSPPPRPPPPPPPRPPPPRPPPQTRLIRARGVLLKFKKFEIVDKTGYTNNWKGSDPCKYKGIRCATYPNTKEKAVAGIDLNQAKITGVKNGTLKLSDVLGEIPELTFFHVNSNGFGGNLPDLSVNKFKYFYELDLSNNKLSGAFPIQVLQATNLTFLDIRFNQLSGPIPPELFVQDLDVIFINNNLFSGNLPSNFGSTPARYLTFANNQFSGTIPSSIGKASKTLTEVLFLGNNLDGCLPYEIGLLGKATVFDASKNIITGPIPHSFGCLKSIQFLNLASNQLYGPVPEIVCILPGLRNNGNLSLSDNYFTQVGPECLKLIESKVLDVNNNCILGLPNQRSPEECHMFFSNAKPCSNPKSFHYIPCKPYYSQLHSQAVAPPLLQEDSSFYSSPPEPVTYKTLRPHRL